MLLLLTVKRRGEAQAVRLRGVEDQAFVQRGFYYGIGRIIRQRQPPHQALAAQLAVAVAVGQASQAFAKIKAGLAHMLKKTVLQHRVEYRRAGRRHQRIAVMGAFQFTDFETTRLATRQQRRQRHAAAQAFAEGDDVGTHAVLLFGQQRAATTEAGLHFVEDQQNPQFTAQTLDALEVVLGRRDYAGALDRLKHDGNGLRIDSSVQGRQVVERHMAETRQLRLETVFQGTRPMPPAPRNCGHGNRCWR